MDKANSDAEVILNRSLARQQLVFDRERGDPCKNGAHERMHHSLEPTVLTGMFRSSSAGC